MGANRFGLGVCVLLSMMIPIQVSTASASPPCGTWNTTPTPNVGNSVTRLTAISSISADDAWSVGHWRNEPSGRGPLVLHWNGSVWSLRNLPETQQLGNYPETVGVDAAPNGDVWVVGNVTTTYPTYNLPLVLRWRNGTWDHVDTATLRPQTVYPYAARGGFAVEVDAIAEDDIWAVGLAAGFGDGQATSIPLAIHWDGSDWTDVDVPRVANRHHELNDVLAISSNDVWAVGDYRNVAGTYRGVTYHWDGSEWSHIPSPIEDMSQSGLNDVVATGPSDVWAIGSASEVGVVLMHWNGFQWNVAEPPPNSSGSLAAVGANDLWVSGWNGFWHWDGTSWTEVPAFIPDASYVIRSGGMEIVGDCDIWSVGFWTEEDGTTSFSLAERLQQSATAVLQHDVVSSPLSFPNPFVPGSRIHLDLSTAGPARLGVYDVCGREVKTLFESQSAKGSRSLTWNGTGHGESNLPAGVYFLKLAEGEKTTTAKLVLLR